MRYPQRAYSKITFFFILVFFLSLVPTGAPAAIMSQPYIPDSLVVLSSGYAVVVDKQAQQLYVFKKNGSIIKVFEAPCSTGKKQGMKQEPGDAKTPTGIFFITKYYNRAELTSIYGTMALHLDFPNVVNRRAGYNGTNIWIHGTNKPLQPFQSNGCVALRNQDIEQLVRYIFLNKTPVIIEESVKWVPQDKQNLDQAELERIMYTWDRAVNEGDARALTELYMPDSKERGQWQPLLQKSHHLRSLVQHLPMYPRDVSILKEDHSAVMLFDKITGAKGDGSFQGEYIKLFLEKKNERWSIVEDIKQPTMQASTSRSKQQMVQAKPSVPVQPAVAIVTSKQPDQKAATPKKVEVATLAQNGKTLQKSATVKADATPDKAIHQLVNTWAASWQAGDMSIYRSCYAPEFKSKGMNLNKYIDYKENLARKYRKISVQVSNVKIDYSGDQHATVTLTQRYNALGAITSSGAKKLELKLVKDSWKIYREYMSKKSTGRHG